MCQWYTIGQSWQGHGRRGFLWRWINVCPSRYYRVSTLQRMPDQSVTLSSSDSSEQNCFYMPCLMYSAVLVVTGTRLLTAGEVIQMWQMADHTSGSTSGPPVEFYFDDQDTSSTSVTSEWLCVWQCQPANPVTLVKFSSDSLLFATIGKVSCWQWSIIIWFWLC